MSDFKHVKLQRDIIQQNLETNDLHFVKSE